MFCRLGKRVEGDKEATKKQEKMSRKLQKLKEREAKYTDPETSTEKCFNMFFMAQYISIWK